MRAIILFLLLTQLHHSFAQSDTLANAQELSPRGGLPNFFAKIQKGKTVKVAYLGGSITRADHGWREQSFQWLKKEFPQAQLSEIMAAIGGTGSDFGAYRLQTHVLQHQPDLVFVEFAVNDNGKSAPEVKAAMEGIVRQIWRKNRRTDICFVYTFSRPQLEFYQRGKFPVSASAMEAVADYYQIPSIAMALPAVQLITEGKMLLQAKVSENPAQLVFSEDGVHPLVETGHKIYAEAVQRQFKVLQSIGNPGAHALTTALLPQNLEKARMLALDQVKKSAGWRLTDSVVLRKPFADLMPPVYSTADTAQFLTLRFKGSSLGWLDVMGPSSGQIVVWIDDDAPRYLNRFDEYCTYYRMSYSLINGLSEGKHRAVIKVSPNELDKAAILQKRNNKINNPQLYAGRAFYVGAFLIKK